MVDHLLVVCFEGLEGLLVAMIVALDVLDWASFLRVLDRTALIILLPVTMSLAFVGIRHDQALGFLQAVVDGGVVFLASLDRLVDLGEELHVLHVALALIPFPRWVVLVLPRPLLVRLNHAHLMLLQVTDVCAAWLVSRRRLRLLRGWFDDRRSGKRDAIWVIVVALVEEAAPERVHVTQRLLVVVLVG